MAKIIESTWYNHKDQQIGIVKTEDEITKEIKYRIGAVGLPISKKEDEEHIAKTGARFYPERMVLEACYCKDEDKHGETQVMCCNECGKPTEKFWTST